MKRQGTLAFVIATALFATTSLANSQDALDLCHSAELEGEDVALAIFERGITLARAAIEEQQNDPVAHFALFCNLAKRARQRGFSLRMVGDLRRMKKALDRSLKLKPNYADAVAAKGALLYYMPRFIGGDVKEGERLIRAALALDPSNPTRLVLVDLLTYREAFTEARDEARTSRKMIESTHRQSRKRAGADAILNHMCQRRPTSPEEEAVLAELCSVAEVQTAGPLPQGENA